MNVDQQSNKEICELFITDELRVILIRSYERMRTHAEVEFKPWTMIGLIYKISHLNLKPLGVSGDFRGRFESCSIATDGLSF